MNDPRVTDYALGELDPAAREAFERDLATSTDLQHELQETIALLEALPIATAMNENLTDPARETLRQAAAENLRAARPKHHATRYVLTGSIAAALAIGATALMFTTPPQPRQAQFSGIGDPASPFKNESPLAPPQPAAPASLPEVAANSARLTEAKSQNQAVFSMRSTDGPPVFDGFVNYGSPIAAVDVQRATAQAKPSEPANIKAVRLEGESSSTLAAGTRIQSLKPSSLKLDPHVDQIADSGARLKRNLVIFPSEPLLAPASPATVAGSAYRDATTASLSPSRAGQDFNTEAYDSIAGNAFLSAQTNPLSTLSIDVDTASYANVRRFLTDGQRPPAGAVRIEELVNYFPYTYPQPEDDAPFSVIADVTRAPWNEAHLLARVALKGREIATDKLPASNLVFLIDVSGSMQSPAKLPLLKRSLAALVENISSRDRVAIVVYAGASGLALASTPGTDKPRILDAIDRLEAGGSTNGAEGIQLAYDIARKQFLAEGNNRVILCTDGDFNVGVTSRSELVRLIERERKSGVFLSVLGFGTGNVKDSQMEQLADKGNGNYAYIDTPSEGRKVLVEQMGATLFTIAKDVKIQVEFNPTTVAGYRLIGYENRLLAKEDFNDDTKDAGEIGAGHTVTALYEIVPAGQPLPGTTSVDPLKYQPTTEGLSAKIGPSAPSKDLFTVKLRYKAPDGDTSKLLEKVVGHEVVDFAKAPEDFRFASAVAAFGMKLRGDRNDAALDWAAIQKIARASLGEDAGAYRAEFLTLIQKARQLPERERASQE